MTVVAVLAAAWVALMLLLWMAQRQLIYLPQRGLPPPPADVTVMPTETADGVEHRVWLVPADGEAVARVLVFNGNAGHKGHRLPLARDLAAEGMEVALFDYRGYGDTDGRPSEAGLAADAAAVAEVVFDTHLPVVYLGESLGGGVATALARQRPPAALVLRSPFTSLADIARVHYPIVPARLLLRDRYETEEALADSDVPVLVILGTADSIVPPDSSRRVFEAASGHKHLVELAGLNHNDPGMAGKRVAEETRSFLDELP